MPTIVRLAPTYALTGIPIVAAVRLLPTYALLGEIKTVPLGVTGKQALFNLIMQNTEEVFDIDDFVFGPPLAIADVNKNTEITLYPKVSTGFTGKITFKYNRLSLENLILSPGLSVTTETTAYEFIPTLNDAIGTMIEEVDLAETIVGENYLRLIAGDFGYFFIPGTEITIPK